MGLLPSSQDQQKKLLIAMIPLLLAFAYYQFVHTKRQVEIESLDERLTTLETTNAAAKAIAQEGGPELEQRLALLEQHVLKLEELIPKREEVPELLYSLGQRAQQTGVDLTRMKPETEEVGPHYTKQIYQFGVKGRYHDVGEFLSAVGSLPRIVTATELKLQATANEKHKDGSPLLTAEFRIMTYIVPEPAAPADTAAVPNAQT